MSGIAAAPEMRGMVAATGIQGIVAAPGMSRMAAAPGMNETVVAFRNTRDSCGMYGRTVWLAEGVLLG